MKKILINQTPWETRSAVVQDDLLQNIYFSSKFHKGLERCFFKGIVTKVLPGIQTAFVDIGQEKAGFLHISEVDRELAIARLRDVVPVDEDVEEEEEIVTKTAEQQRHVKQIMDIGKIFKEGEPVLVQVSKEPVYEKGAKLTTCFTLPGRFVVLMPNIPRIVISKKIDDKEERTRLKEIVSKLIPKGMGAIIRTSSRNRTEKELFKDLAILVQTWNAITAKFAKAKNTELIHEDLPMYLQVVRDHLDHDVEVVIVDNKNTQHKIYRFIKGIAPEFAQKVKYYEGPPPLFERFNIEHQIDSTLEKKVHLKSGGSIIIETTEAMTVIDVNTGKFIGKTTLEDTILKTNLEAAQEIVRQLRLRNIGGLIVIDFIDMASVQNRQKLYKTFEQTLREQDKFQSVVLQISEFGLVQMTRKRSGKTLQQQLTETCTHCHGIGVVKSTRTLCHAILRRFQHELETMEKITTITLSVNPKIFDFITHIEYNTILDLEKMYNCRITLLSSEDIEPTSYRVERIQA